MKDNLCIIYSFALSVILMPEYLVLHKCLKTYFRQIFQARLTEHLPADSNLSSILWRAEGPIVTSTKLDLTHYQTGPRSRGSPQTQIFLTGVNKEKYFMLFSDHSYCHIGHINTDTTETGFNSRAGRGMPALDTSLNTSSE